VNEEVAMSIDVRGVGSPVVVVVEQVFDDAAWLRERFSANGPYWNQGRYLSAAGAASQMPGAVASTVGVPWYRQDWALAGEPLVDGAARLLEVPEFAAAARTIFGGTVVRPHTLYANVQLPAIGTDLGHIDVPEFRGVTRDRYPVALLHLMNRSGLFTRWQLDICTAVTWLWDGPRGDFVLWVDGPDRGPLRYAPPLTNRAVVADNDRVFHAVGDFASADGPESTLLTPTSEVWATSPPRPHPGRYELIDGGRSLGSWPLDAVRMSVSWKSYVFLDERAAATFDDHLDDLDAARVLQIFGDELAARGVPLPDPWAIDDALVATLAAIWPKPVPRPT
jgi:hypothetical protein